jgi:hypothetical protein
MFMDAFDAYKKYLAIKLHFTQESYDYFKYNGQTKADRSKFELRKDRYMFHRLSKREDLDLYLASILKEKPDCWVGDLLDTNNMSLQEYWRNARKNRESLSYVVKNDMQQFDSLEDAFLVSDGDWPKIVKYYRKDRIHIETLAVVCAVYNPFSYWDTEISDTIIWPRIKMKLQKYSKFISFDKQKIKDIIQEIY